MTSNRPNGAMIRALYNSDQCRAFLTALADVDFKEDRRDPFKRLEFADWLEDNRLYPEAAGQRWAAKYKKWPAHAPHMCGGWYQVHDLGHIPENHRLLTEIFWPLPEGVTEANHFQITKPFDAERWFLKRCGQIEWDSVNGNPILTVNSIDEAETILGRYPDYVQDEDNAETLSTNGD